ncbi:histamine H2 receptor-like [Ruditapes philippinarum]|uniref:histamine H2 receptor-like n=1 Tax=Ruditapes philippinarum TaxID=129788 RepID=UPI00295AA68B|nr:histamine H2 receptor-like [Ruditapes philippinarum]
METNDTGEYSIADAATIDQISTTADRASEIFTNPIEVTSFIICVLGLIANCLSIIATIHIPHGQSTHSKLIISLGVSDSLILIAILLHNLMYIFTSWDACTKLTKRLILDTALLATLINLFVMAIDHNLAIMKPLHYRRFMSKFRGNCLIIFIWVFSLIMGLTEVIVGLVTKGQMKQPFCIVVSNDEFDIELIIIGVIFFVLLAIVVIYVRIYTLVKQLMNRDRMMHQDEMHSYKAIVTTLLIIGTFTLFWAPDGIFQVYMYIKLKTDRFYVYMNVKRFTTINDILFLLLQFNSLADPLIYAIRLREVQRGYKVVFYKLFPRYRSSLNEEEFRHNHLSFTSFRRNTNPTIVNDTVSSPDSLQDKVFEKAFDNHNNEKLFRNELEITDESSFITKELLDKEIIGNNIRNYIQIKIDKTDNDTAQQNMVSQEVDHDKDDIDRNGESYIAFDSKENCVGETDKHSEAVNIMMDGEENKNETITDYIADEQFDFNNRSDTMVSENEELIETKETDPLHPKCEDIVWHL